MFAWHGHAEPYLIPAQLVLIMLAMGATLTPRDFVTVARRPASLLLALILQWLVAPAIAWGVGRALGASEGWAVGLVLVAAAPSAAMANLFTFLGRGNLPLSVSTTAITTLASVVTVPVVLGTLAQAHLPGGLELPAGRIVREIASYLIAPLAVGMFVRQRLADHAAAVARWGVRGSILILAALTVGALGSGRIDVFAYGWTPPLRILALGTLLALAVRPLAWLTRRDVADTLALTVPTAMRNMGVALLLVRFFFPGRPEQAHVLYTALFYAGASMWFVLPAVLLARAATAPAARPEVA